MNDATIPSAAERCTPDCGEGHTYEWGTCALGIGPKPDRKPAEPERERPYAFATNYLKQDGPTPGMLVHRAFHAMYLPRLMPVCRLLGHKPVVDGTEGYSNGLGYKRRGSRWVCCDRCGTRAETRNTLDPDEWGIRKPYTGELFGPWAHATGGLSAEVVVGKNIPGASVSLAVGSAGDDNTLAAHVRLSPLGAVYVHTERFGTWLQRRLNPTGYDTRVTELGVGDGRLYWRVWAKRGESSRDTPRWRDGSVVIDPRERLWGPVLRSFEKVGDPVQAVVRMPEGDEHEVTLCLERERIGRKRGAGKLSWSVDWSTRKGIPVEPDSWKGGVSASGVDVSDAAVEHGRWVEDACAAIVVQVSAMRTRYGWRPDAPATVGES